MAIYFSEDPVVQAAIERAMIALDASDGGGLAATVAPFVDPTHLIDLGALLFNTYRMDPETNDLRSGIVCGLAMGFLFGWHYHAERDARMTA